MTNEELIATAEVALIRAIKDGKYCVDLQRAINTLQLSINIECRRSIQFSRSVLETELEELK